MVKIKHDLLKGKREANKTLSTDANGNVIVENKNNHTHSYIATSAIKNDLTTGGATNVLSAEQGKTLNTNKLAKNADDTSTGYITAKGFKVSGKSNFLKADGTTADANNYSHPTNYTTYSSDLYKITVNNNGHVSAASKVTIDSSPNSSNTNNLVTSKGVADALSGKAASNHTHNEWKLVHYKTASEYNFTYDLGIYINPQLRLGTLYIYCQTWKLDGLNNKGHTFVSGLTFTENEYKQYIVPNSDVITPLNLTGTMMLQFGGDMNVSNTYRGSIIAYSTNGVANAFSTQITYVPIGTSSHLEMVPSISPELHYEFMFYDGI